MQAVEDCAVLSRPFGQIKNYLYVLSKWTPYIRKFWPASSRNVIFDCSKLWLANVFLDRQKLRLWTLIFDYPKLWLRARNLNLPKVQMRNVILDHPKFSTVDHSSNPYKLRLWTFILDCPKLQLWFFFIFFFIQKLLA